MRRIPRQKCDWPPFHVHSYTKGKAQHVKLLQIPRLVKLSLPSHTSLIIFSNDVYEMSLDLFKPVCHPSFLYLRVTVVVNINCYPDRVENHLKDYPDYVNCGARIHDGWHHSAGRSPRLNKRRKWVECCHSSLLPVCGYNVTNCLMVPLLLPPHHNGLHHQVVSQNNSFGRQFVIETSSK